MAKVENKKEEVVTLESKLAEYQQARNEVIKGIREKEQELAYLKRRHDALDGAIVALSEFVPKSTESENGEK